MRVWAHACVSMYNLHIRWRQHVFLNPSTSAHVSKKDIFLHIHHIIRPKTMNNNSLILSNIHAAHHVCLCHIDIFYFYMFRLINLSIFFFLNGYWFVESQLKRTSHSKSQRPWMFSVLEFFSTFYGFIFLYLSLWYIWSLF